MATKSIQNDAQQSTESTAELGMEGIEYLRGLFQAMITLCQRSGEIGTAALNIALAGKHIADDYHNTLDCIREDAASAEQQS